MTYNADKTWIELSGAAGTMARSLIQVVDLGLNEYNEWQSFRAGRTNAQIATALSRTETEIAELDACYAAFLTAHNALNNVAITQGDYYYSLRKFS
jgi:hypothetical protein